MIEFKDLSILSWNIIKGRQIGGCICITLEVVNLLDKKVFGGNLALKIDIRKAFNTLDRSFFVGSHALFWHQ